MKKALGSKLAASVIKREIGVISSRFSPSKSNSPRSPNHLGNFPNLYSNIHVPEAPVLKTIQKPKNHKFLKYS
jgi:hypothetical protein